MKRLRLRKLTPSGSIDNDITYVNEVSKLMLRIIEDAAQKTRGNSEDRGWSILNCVRHKDQKVRIAWKTITSLYH